MEGHVIHLLIEVNVLVDFFDILPLCNKPPLIMHLTQTILGLVIS